MHNEKTKTKDQEKRPPCSLQKKNKERERERERVIMWSMHSTLLNGAWKVLLFNNNSMVTVNRNHPPYVGPMRINVDSWYGVPQYRWWLLLLLLFAARVFTFHSNFPCFGRFCGSCANAIIAHADSSCWGHIHPRICIKMTLRYILRPFFLLLFVGESARPEFTSFLFFVHLKKDSHSISLLWCTIMQSVTLLYWDHVLFPFISIFLSTYTHQGV